MLITYKKEVILKNTKYPNVKNKFIKIECPVYEKY